VAKRLTRVSRVRKVENSNPNGRPNATQRCKRFATASTSTQVAVLLWHGDEAPQTRYMLRRNTESIIKDLVWFDKAKQVNVLRLQTATVCCLQIVWLIDFILLFLKSGLQRALIACLHDQTKSGFCGGPAFIQPIRAIWKVFKKPWFAGKKQDCQTNLRAKLGFRLRLKKSYCCTTVLGHSILK